MPIYLCTVRELLHYQIKIKADNEQDAIDKIDYGDFDRGDLQSLEFQGNDRTLCISTEELKEE